MFVCTDMDVIYLMKDALEYKVTREGKLISLLEDLGLIIDVPQGAVTDQHPEEVTVKINACITGPFELPEGHTLVSPVFHIEPGVEFAQKPIELSIVHYLDVDDDDEGCSELRFVTAPFGDCVERSKKTIKFRSLDGGTFLPRGRLGKISLRHFCFIGIASKSKIVSESSAEGLPASEVQSVSRRTSPSKCRCPYVHVYHICLSTSWQLVVRCLSKKCTQLCVLIKALS